MLGFAGQPIFTSQGLEQLQTFTLRLDHTFSYQFSKFIIMFLFTFEWVCGYFELEKPVVWSTQCQWWKRKDTEAHSCSWRGLRRRSTTATFSAWEVPLWKLLRILNWDRLKHNIICLSVCLSGLSVYFTLSLTKAVSVKSIQLHSFLETATPTTTIN